MRKQSLLKTTFITTLALLAFAANSILCRLALDIYHLDAASFTSIRLLSGAGMLTLILLLQAPSPKQQKQRAQHTGTWMLFVYATCFSYAYITLDAATGALVLFAAVQITMLSLATLSGYRLHKQEYFGIILAFTGFTYLIFPNISTPSLSGFVLMFISGIAWGIYSYLGKGSQHPLHDTAGHFIKSIPLVMILLLFTYTHATLNSTGIIIAIISGAITSALGYLLWYAALPNLSHTQASVLQLTVPMLTAFAGIVFLSEAISMHFIIASLMILSGIAMVIQYKAR